MNELALPNPGDDVSGYHLLHELGRGGMGVVYVAQRHNEDFALKFILRQAKDDEARFFQEVKAMTLVGQHPHIVAIRDHFSHHNKLCIVCELVVGSDLAALLAQGDRWLWQDAVELIETLADTLAHIHDEGFLHRDIKPANILIRDYDGHVFLTDFGLAGHGAAGTQSGPEKMVGTALYMSPEQMADERDKIGPQSDIWALGVILYQLLTGERPFHGETPSELLGQIMSKNPLETEHWKPTWPSELKTLLGSTLEKSAGDRTQSAAKLAHDCRQLLNAASKLPEPTVSSASWKILALTIIFLLPIFSIAAARWDTTQTSPTEEMAQLSSQVNSEESRLWDRLAKSIYNQRCKPSLKLSLEESEPLRETVSKLALHASERAQSAASSWKRALAWHTIFKALEDSKDLPIPSSFDNSEKELLKLINRQVDASVKSAEEVRQLSRKTQLSYLERTLLIIEGVRTEDWAFVETHYSAKVFDSEWDREKEVWLTEIQSQKLFNKLLDAPDAQSLFSEFDQLNARSDAGINRWVLWNRSAGKRFLQIQTEDLQTAKLLGRILKLSVAFPAVTAPKLSGMQWVALAKIAGRNKLRPLEAALYTQATTTGPESRPPTRCHIKEYLLRLGYRQRDSNTIIKELMELLELGFSFARHDVEEYLAKADGNGTLVRLRLQYSNNMAFQYLDGLVPLPPGRTLQMNRRLITQRLKSLDRAYRHPQGLPKGLRGETLFQKLRWQQIQSDLESIANSQGSQVNLSLLTDLKKCQELSFLSSNLEFYNFACGVLGGNEWQHFYKLAMTESKRDFGPQIRDFIFDWKEAPTKSIQWRFAEIQIVHFIRRRDLVSAKQVLKQGLSRPGNGNQRLRFITYQTVLEVMGKQFVVASRNLSKRATALGDLERGRLAKVFEEILVDIENALSSSGRKDLWGLLDVLKRWEK